MIDRLPEWIEKHRNPSMSGLPGEPWGAFRLPGPLGMTLTVIVGDGVDWSLPGEAWEHVSVRTDVRCPTWKEMDWVKRIWFKPDEWAMQLHAPPADHINVHPHVLHIWRPKVTPIPVPPKACV